MKQYKEDLKKFLCCRRFILCTALAAVISYAFAAANVTISIDDLEASRYVGAGNTMLAAGRFGTWLWSKLQGQWTTPFVLDLLAVLLFGWAIINICILFDKVSQQKIHMWSYTFFACAWISYPLINEIWEYTGTNVKICGGFLLVSFSLLLIYQYLHNSERKLPISLILAAFLMMLVCAGYEAVVPVYIFLVFAILALQVIYGEKRENTFKNLMLQGLIYAAVLLAGLILRVIIHQITLSVMDLEPSSGGATEIYWGTDSFVTIMKNWFLGTARTVLHSIIYFPLTELLIAILLLIILGIGACRRYGVVLLLPGLGMLLSLIILSLIQGAVSPYRTCLVYGTFVAFVIMMLTILVQQHKWKRFKWMRPVALILAGYLCLQQAMYLNYFLTLNHIRSEEEAFVIRNIGTDLKADFDADKPVIFVGVYELSEYVQEAASIPKDSPRWWLYSALYAKANAFLGTDYDSSFLSRKLPQTNVNSVIRWGWYAHDQGGMQNLFAYYGFDYVLADYTEVFAEACQYAVDKQLPSYPSDGYIHDAGDYIIVRLGPI